LNLFSDYHTHPQGHRVQAYTQSLLQPWIDSARQRGLSDIALSDHDRYHGGVDFDEIERVREKNPDVKIRAGIELDNDPESSAAGRKWIEDNWDRLDFVLGSVHFLDHPTQMFDSVPAGAAQFAGRDIDELYADYFRRVRQIAATGLVDCLAHLDLIKIHGHRPNSEIRALIDETLNFIRARNLSIELSTAGWRKPVNELYPSDEIIRLAMEKGIPFTTASDAHSHAQLGENYDRLSEKMASLGIGKVCVYEKHKREIRALKPRL
jgi:histidinol-phosphatase (PHP family)